MGDRTIRSQKLTSVIAGFVFSCFSLTNASATIVEVDFQSTLYVDSDEAIFGVAPGDSGLLQVTFNLDTEDAMVYMAGRRTMHGGLSSDFYGFSATSVLNFSATFGSKNWVHGDITAISYRSDLTADLFFDTEPVVGATTNMHMYLADNFHEAYLGGAIRTSSGLILTSEGQVWVCC